jgi:hypothetical protein
MVLIKNIFSIAGRILLAIFFIPAMIVLGFLFLLNMFIPELGISEIGDRLEEKMAVHVAIALISITEIIIWYLIFFICF